MHSPKRSSGSFNPRPTYMTEGEMSDYLRNLRNNRPTRPSANPDSDPRASVLSFKSSTDSGSGRPSSHFSHRQSSDRTSSTRSPERRDSIQYRDSDQRHNELSEARRIRMAMDQIRFEDRNEEEQRLYDAAQLEASELIRRHKSPNAPYSAAFPAPATSSGTPGRGCDDISNVNRLRPQKSDVGTRNQASLNSEFISPDLPNIKKQSSYSKLANYWNNSGLGQRRRSSGSRRSISGKNKGVFNNPDDKIYEDPGDRIAPTPKSDVPRSHKSSGSQSSSSVSRRNPFARPSFIKDSSMGSDQASKYRTPQPTLDYRGGTERNSHLDPDNRDTEESEAIRYKDGMEVRSDEIRAATGPRYKDRSQKLPSPSAISDDPRRPIVSFQPDWAPKEEQTSHHKYEQTLPQPQPSSNTPPGDSVMSQFVFPPPASASKRTAPQIHVTPSARQDSTVRATTKPTIPTIMVDDNMSSPTRSSTTGNDLARPGQNIPNISVTSPPSRQEADKKHRADDRASKHRYSAFPSPQRQPTLPQSDLASKPHITPTRRATALCAQCALPIAGKIVSAAGLRFHPDCFTCFHCNEGLECVDFYPEPAEKRNARLDRIQRRMDGEDVDDVSSGSEADDGDDSLRFYCHLDFHELFSPRCKSCKTPIEGEVVVACGAEWHVGHFFCAQCGDPFDQTTPFVEKDGYAWCVECHTNRYSAKCKKCKRPVTKTVIQALGAEWHSECFCCTQCGGDFDGGRFFLRSGTQDPVCLACEQKRLKA